MRKTIFAAVGAAALALSSAASAAVTVNSGSVSGLNTPNPSAPGSTSVSADGTTHINFGATDTPANFTAQFTISNTTAGLYDITVGITGGNATFSSVMFNGTPLTNLYNGQNFRLIPPVMLGVGDYVFSLVGSGPAGGAFIGNASVSPAVPEPATWAMMLLGFGAIGLTMRSRRRTALAQIA